MRGRVFSLSSSSRVFFFLESLPSHHPSRIARLAQVALRFFVASVVATIKTCAPLRVEAIKLEQQGSNSTSEKDFSSFVGGRRSRRRWKFPNCHTADTLERKRKERAFLQFNGIASSRLHRHERATVLVGFSRSRADPNSVRQGEAKGEEWEDFDRRATTTAATATATADPDAVALASACCVHPTALHSPALADTRAGSAALSDVITNDMAKEKGNEERGSR